MKGGIIMINVKERILALLKANNMTKYELAKQSGLSESTVMSIFNQKGEPKNETLEKIAFVFGLSLSKFFDENYVPTYSKLELEFNKLSDKSKNIIIYLLKELD